MAGNTVYVRGNYVDVHDNQEVNLYIDKATVQVGDEVKTEKPEVDDRLTSLAAMKYWKRLEEQGFVGHDCQLLPETSRRQAMYIADLFSDKLGLKAKWKPFESLWGISNLAQEKYKMQETGSMPKRYRDIDKVFAD
ncbi:MAG: hypothetical protein K6A94_06715 [Bacteroidales bacterium]|nr:hypothetical protein [Bacteroidales bacterium]